MKDYATTDNWRQFYDSARNNQALDERTKIMLHLAASMALGCEP